LINSFGVVLRYFLKEIYKLFELLNPIELAKEAEV
jgi:hypothetical protein